METGGSGSDAATMGVLIAIGEHPRKIGPYRILRLLGQGGMGMVYLAEQTEPVRREVAIKILKTGIDSERFVARFEAERQALAVMEHPGITKVFDAGVTETGWPYFVMERVSGVPLTEYADAHRLTIADRVRLFAQICRAVQHAHQKGIIHRDLKPSNVLVTESDGAPVCKVIDFGIAKATEGDTARLTQTGLSVGTPAYMSPEQAVASELDVDTRADVYSLGVMLYELLSGVLPFELGAFGAVGLMARHASEDAVLASARVAALPPEKQEALAALRQTDAAGLRQALARDLDWIAIKALEKERERRYQTAIAFAEDLERYLAQEPVVASPLSGTYRARKFVRRHRLAVAFAGTVVLLLVAFSIAATVQARRLARARTIAVQRQGQAEELISFMIRDLRPRLDSISPLDLLAPVDQKAQAYFAAVSEGELSDAELFRRSQALSQLGEVRNKKGDLPGAMQLFRQSLDLVSRVANHDTLNGDWQLGLGASHFWVGFMHYQRNDLDSALAHFVPYKRITESLVAREPNNLKYRNELGQANSNIGSVKEAQGDLAGALAAFRFAIAAKEFAARRDTTKLSWRLDLANSYNSAAVIQRKLGDLTGAERMHRAELAVKQSLVARDPANRTYQMRLASAHSFLGDLLTNEGNPAAGLPELIASRSLYASLAASDTTNPDGRRLLATANLRLGVAHLELGDVPTAIRDLQASRALVDPSISRTPDNTVWQQAFARTLTIQATALAAAGRSTEAEAAARRAVSIDEPALRSKPRDQNVRAALADAYLALGEAQARKGNDQAARASWTAAAATIDSVARATQITDQLALLGSALLRLDRLDEARPVVQELLRRGYKRPRWMALVREKGAGP